MAFFLPEDVRVVKGYFRSCLYDLTREDFEFIPNSLANKLTYSALNEIDEKDIISFLRSKDMLIDVHQNVIDNFIPLKLNWESSSFISNIIINAESLTNEVADVIANMICIFNVKAIVIECFEDSSLEHCIDFINKLSYSKLKTLEVLMNFSCHGDSVINKIFKNKKVKNIIFYNAPFKKIIQGYDGFENIVYLNYNFTRTQNKDMSFFNVNIDLYSESLLFNTYFNRKVYISATGDVKKSHESIHCFGNINDCTLDFDAIYTIINNTLFNQYSTVSKRKCDVCKFCEFRHMCVDARVPISRGKSDWYFEKECNYNPFIAKWSFQEDYLSLSECKIFSNEDGFHLDEIYLEDINKKLWGVKNT